MRAARSTRSVWSDTFEKPNLGTLSGDLNVDVAIVGAGITGLTAAALLKKSGKTVAVLERETFGRHGATHRTTAHVTVALDQSYNSLVRKFSHEQIHEVLRITEAAIDWIEAAAIEFSFDNEFRRVDGYYYAELSQNAQDIERDFDAAISLGLQPEMVDHIPLPINIATGYRLPRQGQFHPLKHLAGLAAYVNGGGGGSMVCDRTHVRDFKDGGDGGGLCTLKTDHGTITAADVILATHTPMGVWKSLQTRLVPYMSYVIAARVEGEPALGLYWDNADPYNYIRRFSGGAEDPNLLIIGGADTKTGSDPDTQKSFDTLEKYARDRFQVQAIEHRWSAQFFEPADGLPYIGLGPGCSNTYVATGYSGTGMTYGTAAAMIIHDMIMQRQNPCIEIFKPSRLKPIASAKHVFEEAVASVKGLVTDRLFKVAGRDIDAIKPGEGQLISADGERLAVYRDERGEVKAVSPVCTHLGCMVEWNNAEKNWDCKCHGSRFNPDGEVIDGPATSPLEKREIETHEADQRSTSKTASRQ